MTREILDDSYNAPEAILCPRVENEFLSAYKSFFARSFGTGLQKEELLRPANLIKWVNDSITMLRDPKAWSIPMSPAGVYQARRILSRERSSTRMPGSGWMLISRLRLRLWLRPERWC